MLLPQPDHPRGCGENSEPAGKMIVNAGSPPRMRGKHGGTKSEMERLRITPADAGKTRQPQVPKSGGWDHPRGCGENTKPGGADIAYIGSPPRMRGKLIQAIVDALPQRITPADAGKTALAGRAHRMSKDHPRGCGENSMGHMCAVCLQGSPPRMRGKPAIDAAQNPNARITPADAGKTCFKD